VIKIGPDGTFSQIKLESDTVLIRGDNRVSQIDQFDFPEEIKSNLIDFGFEFG
jgi:hypothetical protein